MEFFIILAKLLASALLATIVLVIVALFCQPKSTSVSEEMSCREPQEPTLTEKEIEVLFKLEEVDKDSLWGLGIKQVLEQFSITRYRELICQLKSQNADDPYTMKQILGPAYDHVISL